MDGSELNHISLVLGLSDNYIRRTASKDAENWKTMADVFDSIVMIVKTAGKTKAYNKPRYENPHSITVVSVKITPNIDISHVYELNHKFPLPRSVILIDVIHKRDYKIP